MRQSSLGFTLVELLVAMSIFSIMTVMAYGGLNSVLTTREHVDESSNQLRQLQRVFILLEQDLYHLNVQVNAAMTGEFLAGRNSEAIMRFTRSVSVQAAGSPTLGVRYQLTNGHLVRHLQVGNGVEHKMQLLDGIKGLDVRFFYQKWHRSWPPSEINKGGRAPAFPYGVKIEIDSQHWGKVTRILSLQ